MEFTLTSVPRDVLSFGVMEVLWESSPSDRVAVYSLGFVCQQLHQFVDTYIHSRVHERLSSWTLFTALVASGNSHFTKTFTSLSLTPAAILGVIESGEPDAHSMTLFTAVTSEGATVLIHTVNLRPLAFFRESWSELVRHSCKRLPELLDAILNFESLDMLRAFMSQFYKVQLHEKKEELLEVMVKRRRVKLLRAYLEHLQKYLHTCRRFKEFKLSTYIRYVLVRCDDPLMFDALLSLVKGSRSVDKLSAWFPLACRLSRFNIIKYLFRLVDRDGVGALVSKALRQGIKFTILTKVWEIAEECGVTFDIPTQKKFSQILSKRSNFTSLRYLLSISSSSPELLHFILTDALQFNKCRFIQVWSELGYTNLPPILEQFGRSLTDLSSLSLAEACGKTVRCLPILKHFPRKALSAVVSFVIKNGNRDYLAALAQDLDLDCSTFIITGLVEKGDVEWIRLFSGIKFEFELIYNAVYFGGLEMVEYVLSHLCFDSEKYSLADVVVQVVQYAQRPEIRFNSEKSDHVIRAVCAILKDPRCTEFFPTSMLQYPEQNVVEEFKKAKEYIQAHSEV